MLYKQVANAFSHRFLTFFFFILMPGRKVRPSFFLGGFSEVAYVGEVEFDFRFNIKNPGL